MADTPDGAGKGKGTFGFLGRHIGPVPVWLIALGLVAVYYWYTHYGPGASSSTTASDQIDPVTGASYASELGAAQQQLSDLQSQQYGGAGAGSGGGGSGTDNSGSTTTTTGTVAALPPAAPPAAPAPSIAAAPASFAATPAGQASFAPAASVQAAPRPALQQTTAKAAPVRMAAPAAPAAASRWRAPITPAAPAFGYGVQNPNAVPAFGYGVQPAKPAAAPAFGYGVQPAAAPAPQFPKNLTPNPGNATSGPGGRVGLSHIKAY